MMQTLLVLPQGTITFLSVLYCCFSAAEVNSPARDCRVNLLSRESQKGWREAWQPKRAKSKEVTSWQAETRSEVFLKDNLHISHQR